MNRKPSLLLNGLIPCHTECPFRSQCGSAQSGHCNHKGIEHTVDFSCAYARLGDMLYRNSVDTNKV